jgi:hypothetical protein
MFYWNRSNTCVADIAHLTKEKKKNGMFAEMVTKRAMAFSLHHFSIKIIEIISQLLILACFHLCQPTENSKRCTIDHKNRVLKLVNSNPRNKKLSSITQEILCSKLLRINGRGKNILEKLMVHKGWEMT